MKNIPGAKPFFINKKKINSDIKKTLNSGILSPGPFLKKFENLKLIILKTKGTNI